MNLRNFIRQNQPKVLAVITAIILIVFSFFFSYQRFQLLHSQQMRLLENKLQNIKDRLDGVLNNSLAATKTLSLFITDYNGEQNFYNIAPQILHTHSNIDALEVVKEGVITQIYPIQENEKAIGYDILKDTMRNKEAYEAIERNQLFFAGPIELRQGYKAIVGRLPIIKDDKFWGFSVVLIKFSTFLKTAGLDISSDSNFVYQFSKVDPNTNKEEFFLPEQESFFKNKDYGRITIYDGNWNIYARAKNEYLLRWMAPIFLISLILTMLASFQVYSLASQPYLLRKLVNQKTHEIKESEEKFRTLVEQAQAGVFIEQFNRMIYVNPAFEKIFGYSLADLQANNGFVSLLNTDDETSQAELISKESLKPLTLKAQKASGEVVFIELILSKILYHQQPALMGTFVDITNRIERDARVNRAVIEAQEEERRQIGMELHDNVLQILAASVLNIDFLKIRYKDHPEIVTKANSVKVYLNDSIDEIRRLSHQLTPSLSEKVTLVEKIQNLISNYTTSGTATITTAIDDFQPVLNNEIQIGLYRILQEQLNNIHKHAGATSIHIKIRKNNNLIQLKITDNGIGFNTNLPSKGIGLENIKRRVRAMGGDMKIISSLGNGCELIIKIPVQQYISAN